MDLLCDTGFKILFGRESSMDILIGFLNAVLDGEGLDPIVELTYLDKEKCKESPDERTIFYDIHCKTKSGHRFIVEMQNKPQSFFRERSIFYVARAITEQGEPGDWEYDFMPVYSIALTQFRLHPDEKRLRVDVMLKDMETNETFSKSIRLIYIQLPNFNITTPEECRNDFEKWIFILKNLRDMETMPFVQDIFRRVENVARVENLSPEDRRNYERDLKFYRDYRNTLKFAEKEGLAQGMAQGMAQGVTKGKTESLREMVHSMSENGLDIDMIARIAKIGVAQVKEILGL